MPGRFAETPREATRAEAETALKKLEVFVKTGLSDPSNPWALAHGLTAFGKNHKASDGRLAADVIVTDFLQKTKVDGKERYSFPKKTADNVPVSPHANVLLKAMIGAGITAK